MRNEVLGWYDGTAWFDFLSRQVPDEVNFWQPRGEATYASLDVGSIVLFKLKRPYNDIAGGAYFVKSSSLPLSMVWEAFGTKNGAHTRITGTMIGVSISVCSAPAWKDVAVACIQLDEPR